MQEEWKDISGFQGVYYISSMGRVKHVDKIIASTPNKNRRGYCYSNLEHNGKRKNAIVHRLVALHFIPNPENKKYVNHIDFNTSNNCVENLEWVTAHENMQHSARAGRTVRQRGEDAPCSKLSIETVRLIREELATGKLSYTKIANKFNTNYSNVAHIKRGSRWGFST